MPARLRFPMDPVPDTECTTAAAEAVADVPPRRRLLDLVRTSSPPAERLTLGWLDGDPAFIATCGAATLALAARRSLIALAHRAPASNAGGPVLEVSLELLDERGDTLDRLTAVIDPATRRAHRQLGALVTDLLRCGCVPVRFVDEATGRALGERAYALTPALETALKDYLTGLAAARRRGRRRRA